MYTYLEKIILRVVIHRTRVVEKKRKLRVPFSPSTNRNRVHRTKISTKTDKDGFSHAVFRSRLEQKIPATEYLGCCFRVLFFLAKSMLRMGSCVRFCCHNILFHRTMCGGKGSHRSMLYSFDAVAKFLQGNQKLNFDQRFSCITRHVNFSPRSHRAVSLQGYLRDRRAGHTERKTSELIVI